MIDWFFQTLKSYPEIAIMLSLALGYYFGSFTYKGLGLGAVTATLIAAVIIGQIGITVTGPPQLSEAVTRLMFGASTCEKHWKLNGAGQVIDGGVVSLTVIVCVHVAWLPHESVAE